MISFAAVEYFFNLFESYLSYSLHLIDRQRFQKNYKGQYRLKLIGGSVRELKTKVVFTLLLAEARRTSLLFGAIAPDRQILVGCNYGGHQDHVSCHRKYRSLIKNNTIDLLLCLIANSFCQFAESYAEQKYR